MIFKFNKSIVKQLLNKNGYSNVKNLKYIKDRYSEKHYEVFNIEFYNNNLHYDCNISLNLKSILFIQQLNY